MAAACRRSRNEAWTRHRAALSGETADAFAAALERDDDVNACRLASAGALADIRPITHGLAEAAADIARIGDKLARADMEVNAASSHMRAAASGLLGLVEASLEDLIELIERRTSARADALAAWQEIELAAKKVGRASEDEARQRLDLARALESVGIGSDRGDSLETIMRC
ncbi:hypothetical protein LB516_20600 [Mesorhizobium sp. CO1-1-7]|uniref:hypothetical protein n=1 Tax=Mesorhizobium sp. CO1-1-7 TaxID=2876632 RepID=UPI001CD071B8|nr:hypothetical protein [Mesorhizobium sp. CO1-1-7]MBZ9747650.1 hypothetical protein [Mesorhizobium sp. CO1-1-7]